MVAATARENQREQVIRELEEGRATLQAQIAAHELAGDASCKKRATLQAQIAALQQEVREGKASLEAQMAEHQAVVEKKDARIAADQQMSAFSSFHHHDCLRRNLELQEMLQTSASCSKELQDELRTAKMVMKHTEARNALLESKFNGGPNGCTSGCSGEEGVTLDVS
jgi:chromosome segregation ATPase